MNITHQTEQNVFQFKPPVIVYNPNVSSRNGLGLNNEAVNSDGSDMCEEEKGGSEPKGEDPKTYDDSPIFSIPSYSFCRIFQFVANMSPQAFKSDGSPITDFKPAPVTGILGSITLIFFHLTSFIL